MMCFKNIDIYRRWLPIQNNHTNNFVETAVRLFKDNVLNRKQLYNPVEVIDFVIESMTEYYQKRLTDFANFRNVNQHLCLEKIMNQIEKADIDAVEHCMDMTYSMPSSNDPLVKRVVDIEYGVCTCEYGMYGRFCKHMAAVYLSANVPLPNFPGVTAQDRYQMAWIAMGDQAMPFDFYQSLHGELADCSNV